MLKCGGSFQTTYFDPAENILILMKTLQKIWNEKQITVIGGSTSS
jgi:hypothetical protein